MRLHWWLVGATSGAVLASIAGVCWQHSHWWPELLIRALAPGLPAGRGGLVREEDVYGPYVPEDEEEEAALLAQVPRGAGGILRVMAQTTSAQFSRWLRLEELQLRRPQRGHGSGPGGSGPGDAAPQEELRGFVHDLVFSVAVFLKVLGTLLLMLVPTSLLAYGLLSLPIPFVLDGGLVSRFLEGCLAFVEWLALPPLLGATRLLGISRREALGEDVVGPEVVRRAKRAILGLLVLNVALSFLAVIALANVVLVVRASGVLSV
mmetsp:Transcript_58908/g.117882  ORF Transcript_58908/g.117882 Transcript_58908/m.117882 type:complete len:263 (-) Transcript_58908:145-933(-)